MSQSEHPTLDPSDASAPASAHWRHLDEVLHRFFRARVSDPQLRADLVQDVLLRMHERREQLREDDRLEAWAYRIARNVLVDHFRRARPSDPLPEPAELAEPPPEPNSDAPRVLGSWLRSQIHKLPAHYREALELTELRGLSQREAAAALGLPYSTLKSRVQRGREQLHADLLACCAVELDVRGRVTDFAPRTSSPCGCTPTTCKPGPPKP
ncbi:RNA polymerase sigma factor SigZ [Enhygromyxa salina]|uniref:RNA polymerase sigma factor SigZ n=1 Tax=Enhygromyxa salina TaxID=215803 RepID=A0A0C2CWW5_9BACT|nr:sigma-70 family RNA polymerase sigma factor [Enhygromyxa salina]KIG14115.1 RNA polymerase sigma factor SigZ [Enhygromyxa salina]